MRFPDIGRRALAHGILAMLVPLVLAAGGCSAPGDESAAARSPSGSVTEAEAAAALLDYFDAVNEALQTGDTESLAALTGPRCPCRDLVALIDDRFADGGELVGASFDAGAVTVLGRGTTEARVRAHVAVSRHEVRTTDGVMLRPQPARDFVATYTVRRGTSDDSWQVTDVRQNR
jgi:hypothetical protein